MEHLPKIVRQIERGSAKDLIRDLPVVRRDDFLEANPIFDIMQANFFELTEDLSPKCLTLLGPVNIRCLMCDRDKHIQCTHAARCKCVIRDTGILHVERWVLRQNLEAIDLVQIFFVVLGNVDRVMRQIVISSVDAEIHHERGT